MKKVIKPKITIGTDKNLMTRTTTIGTDNIMTTEHSKWFNYSLT